MSGPKISIYDLSPWARNIQGNVKITIDDIDAENMPYALTCTYEEII